MQRQVVQPKKEEKGPLVQIKLGGPGKPAAGGSGAGSGFKKGGFKNAFGAKDGEMGIKKEQKEDVEMKVESAQTLDEKEADDESDFKDEEDYYDPRRPTGCTDSCRSVVAVERG